MKKFISMMLALVMALCVFSFASAEGTLDVPQNVSDYDGLTDFNLDDFAKIKTKHVDQTTTVTLSKAVDSIQANWMGYQEEPEELTVTDLTATVDHTGHRYQLGTAWTNGYWEPFAWEDVHDVYFSFNDSKEEIEAGIAAVWKYMNTGDYLKTETGKEFASEFVEVSHDVEIVLPQYGIYILEETQTDEGPVLERTELEVFDYGTKMEDIQKAYEAYVKANPGKEVFMSDYGGYAWGKLIGREYYKTVGAPDYAYITKQGDFKVVYGRNGSVKYFEKTVPDVDLFGIGVGTATFTFKTNNAGWTPVRVRMDFEYGTYKSVTAKDDGCGRLYGIGLN